IPPDIVEDGLRISLGAELLELVVRVQQVDIAQVIHGEVDDILRYGKRQLEGGRRNRRRWRFLCRGRPRESEGQDQGQCRRSDIRKEVSHWRMILSAVSGVSLNKESRSPDSSAYV